MLKREQRKFSFTLRVPYAHTDQMRVVYYANYLVYFEMARAAMMREAGLPYAELEERGVILPVVEAHCVYQTPARFDDLLVITSCCSIEGLRLRVACAIARAATPIAHGHTMHVCVSTAGRVLRPLPELNRLL